MITLFSLTFMTGGIFLLALLMNLVRKNTTLITLYALQSLIVAISLVLLSATHGKGLIFAAFLTLGVKVLMAPIFLTRMVRKYSAHFSAASYLNTPLSLFSLALLTVFSYSFVFNGIGALQIPGSPLAIASIFSMLFLMVNRRGALGQIVGVLALENGVVLLASLLGIENSFALEFVIAFDIAIWIAIASVFLTMMYREFGDVEAAASKMTKLTEI